MAQSLDLVQADQPSRHSRLSLVLAFAAFILIGANDGALGVLIPSIRAFYQVDVATFSLVFLLSVVGYLAASFNTGLLNAWLGERRFLLMAFAFVIAGVGLISLRLLFPIYLGTALLLGFGVGMLDAGLNTYIASLPDNTKLLNYLHAFYGAGALLGPLVASTLIAWNMGWQATYVTWLGFALLLWIGFWLAFTPYTQRVKRLIGEKRERLLRQTLGLRVVWLAALFLLFYVGTEVSLGSWGYSFLTIARMGPVVFSAWVISGYWFGLMLGRLTLANLAARMGVRRLITFCLGGIFCSLLLAWFLPGIWGAATGFCLTGFFLGPLFPTAIALMSQIAPARLLPTAIGFMASLGSAGAALFPSLAGTLVQHLGFWFLLPFALVLTIVMLAVWLVLNRVPAQTEQA